MRGREKAGNADAFVEMLKQDAYAKIDRRYFELLWRALDAAPKKTLSSIRVDPFAELARGGHVELLRERRQRSWVQVKSRQAIR
jgi:hypothetical protein